MIKIRGKRTARILMVALAVTMGIGGLSTETRAYQINSGDLVLAVYGNGTEYYQDLGSAASLLATSVPKTFDLNLSSLNPLVATGGSQPVQWTLVRNTFGTGIPGTSTFVNLASQQTTQEIMDSQNTYSVSQANGNIRSWQSTISGVSAPLGTELLLNASDPASFTTTMGFGGSLNGSFPSILEGSLGSLMTILQGRATGNLLSDVGRATLSANGLLTICGGAGCSLAPVPLPAAVVLFGSGLIGLVGIARRKLKG